MFFLSTLVLKHISVFLWQHNKNCSQCTRRHLVTMRYMYFLTELYIRWTEFYLSLPVLSLLSRHTDCSQKGFGKSHCCQTSNWQWPLWSQLAHFCTPTLEGWLPAPRNDKQTTTWLVSKQNRGYHSLQSLFYVILKTSISVHTPEYEVKKKYTSSWAGCWVWIITDTGTRKQ